MRNFYDWFATTAERFPNRAAVEVQRRASLDSFAYAELLQMAGRVAGYLAGRGIGPGDCCAILADNDAHWCAAELGILQLGGVAVPFDTAYKARQIAALLDDSRAKILFTTPRYLASAAEAVRASRACGEIVLLHGPLPTPAGPDTETRIVNLDGVLKAAPLPRPGECLQRLEACPATPRDPALILYTSGTTADPKGVVLTHGNLLAEIEAVLQVIRVDESDVILGVLPLFHALAQMANLLLPFAVGARVVFLESLNLQELLRALPERGVTAFCWVPQFFYLIHQRILEEAAAAGWMRRALFRALLRANGVLRHRFGLNLGPQLFRRVHDVLGRQIRLLVTGGSPFDPQVGQNLYRLGFDVLQAYGLTECAGAATLTRPGEEWSSSVGTPLPGVELKILPRKLNSPSEAAGAGSIAARRIGEPPIRDGEVAIRGSLVMQGYLRRADANAETLCDGWLCTGDLGYIDSRGRLHLTGRKKEIVVLSSGKNIYPEEIEAHYLESPYIKELCVLGLARPGEPSAERLYAVVVPDFDVLRQRKVLNAREILRYEIEGHSLHLPSHKRILSYEIWTEELPRTTTRKLKRFEIVRKVAAQAAAPAEEAATDASPLSAEELAWTADPHVVQALRIIREAAKPTATAGGGKRIAIRPDANIELELSLDSMERVELLTRLEEAFGTRVPTEVAPRIYTIRELVEAVRPALPKPGYAGDANEPAALERQGSDAWGRLLRAPLESDPALAGLLEPRPAMALATFLALRLFFGVVRLLLRFRVAGRENLPKEGPFLLCPNHQSFLDPFLLVSALPFHVLRNLFFVGASEYFATPLRAWFARKINLVPVDPDTNLLRAMQAGSFGLRHGKVLVLFPEGERSIDGEIKKFKKGAAILSLHTGVPIVPTAFAGVFDVWPRGRAPRWRALLPGRRVRLSMRFGPPLPPPAALPGDVPAGEAEAHYLAATEQLRATVEKLWLALRSQRTPE